MEFTGKALRHFYVIETLFPVTNETLLVISKFVLSIFYRLRQYDSYPVLAKHANLSMHQKLAYKNNSLL